MANMSYCRFQNTVADLQDCYEAMCEGEDDDLSAEEADARSRLIQLCSNIHDEYADE